jgi:glycosyltransferase involved in cell wall biosynthesis
VVVILQEPASISVVVPTFNNGDRLEGAIRSALDQEPKPIEIIVVDDGSVERVDSMSLDRIDPCIRIIRHESNFGGSAARNTGIEAACGDFVAFLDADDRWLPGKLKTQVPQILDRKSENVFACANIRFDGGSCNGLLYNHRPPLEGEDISRYFLIHGCTFQTSTLIVPTLLANSVRFDDRLRRHQDWDFVLRLIKNGAHFLYCHEPLVAYWDGVESNRVSKQSSIEPALLWLKVDKDAMALDAAAYFYFRTTFRQHFAQEPVSALLMALKFCLTDRQSAAKLLKRIPLLKLIG